MSTVNIHHYAPPRTVLQQAAALNAALHALRRQYTSEGSMSSFKSITWNELWSQKWYIRQLKIWDGRSVGNVSRNVYAKFRCASLRIKKALGIFRELVTTTTTTTTITTTRTTKLAFWDPPFGSNKLIHIQTAFHLVTCRRVLTVLQKICDKTWIVLDTKIRNSSFLRSRHSTQQNRQYNVLR